MKILMTTDTVGGVWSYATDLAEELLYRNIEVVLAAMGPELDTGQQQRIDDLKLMGINFYHETFYLEWMREGEFDPKPSTTWLKKITKKETPHLIHLNSFGQVDAEWDVPVLLVVHSCVVTWWKAVHRHRPPRNWKPYTKLVKNALLAADRVVAPTRAHLIDTFNAYGVERKGEVIYNGCQIPHVEEFIAKKRPIVFCAGRIWDQAKNINLLLNAAPAIRGEIYLAGNQHHFNGLSENVNFLGKISRQQLFHWLNISSVYVLPAMYEPFGLSLLEAAVRHCAVIGGEIPSLKEIWSDSIQYVRSFDKTGLEEMCNKLLDSPENTAQWAEKAYNRGMNYTVSKMADRYIDVYLRMRTKSKAQRSAIHL